MPDSCAKYGLGIARLHYVFIICDPYFTVTFSVGFTYNANFYLGLVGGLANKFRNLFELTFLLIVVNVYLNFGYFLLPAVCLLSSSSYLSCKMHFESFFPICPFSHSFGNDQTDQCRKFMAWYLKHFFTEILSLRQTNYPILIFGAANNFSFGSIGNQIVGTGFYQIHNKFLAKYLQS